MDALSLVASEAAGESGGLPWWGFGLLGFATLLLLLFAVTRFNPDR